jgi:hypothetical protein
VCLGVGKGSRGKANCWVSEDVVNECRKLVGSRRGLGSGTLYDRRAGVPSFSANGQQREGALQDHNKQIGKGQGM